MDDDFHKWRWRFLTIWIIVFTGTTIWGIEQRRQQGDENHRLIVKVNEQSKQRTEDLKRLGQDRLRDLNKARILSCRQGRQDLLDLLALASAKSRANFSDQQEAQYELLLHQFSPDKCK